MKTSPFWMVFIIRDDVENKKAPAGGEDRRALEDVLREIRGQLMDIQEEIHNFRTLFPFFMGVEIAFLFYILRAVS